MKQLKGKHYFEEEKSDLSELENA